MKAPGQTLHKLPLKQTTTEKNNKSVNKKYFSTHESIIDSNFIEWLVGFIDVLLTGPHAGRVKEILLLT